MKRSKFTDAQKAFVLRQAEEGTPVSKVCRKRPAFRVVVDQSYAHYAWRMLADACDSIAASQ